MTNVGRKEFKLARTRRKADAARSKKKVSLKKPRTRGRSKAPGKRRLGKPS